MHDSSCVFENKMHGYTKGAKGIYWNRRLS